jgi:hypothetical protein
MVLITQSSDRAAAEDIGAVLARCTNSSDLVQSGILFHGTGESLEGPLRCGGDGMFWTARSSVVAQSYIPHSGLTAYFGIDSHQLQARLSPGTIEPLVDWALKRCRASLDDLDIERDRCGNLRSWRIPEGWPTWQDARDHLMLELGYSADRHGLFELSISSANGKERIMPAEWRLPGSLIVLHVPDLQVIRLGEDGDLIDPQHLWADKFNAAEAAGAEAIEIGDFLQSRRFGNVGHRAIGLTGKALARARYVALDAINFDFNSVVDFSREVTPHFQAFWSQCRSRLDPAPALAG